MKNLINFNRTYNKELNLVGFQVITVESTYLLEDMYGNVLYIAKTNQQAKVQDLFLSGALDEAKTIDKIDLVVRKHFNRKQ